MKQRRKLWTRDELLLTFNLYLKLPFGKLDARTKEVVDLATILGRTPGSISMRLNNFASVDPYHIERGIGGLPGGKKQVQPIWNEFVNNKEEFLFETEMLLAKNENVAIEKKFAQVLKGLEHLKGENKLREVKTRVNQNVFRQVVMSNYNNKCAITGIAIPELLVASHIIPWSKNENERLNPRNGLCLNALHDRAFDIGLITISADDYTVKVSSRINSKYNNDSIEHNFLKFKGCQISLPDKFLPEKEFLKIHNKFFKN